jgi:hypothetical protein
MRALSRALSVTYFEVFEGFREKPRLAAYNDLMEFMLFAIVDYGEISEFGFL